MNNSRASHTPSHPDIGPREYNYLRGRHIKYKTLSTIPGPLIQILRTTRFIIHTYRQTDRRVCSQRAKNTSKYCTHFLRKTLADPIAKRGELQTIVLEGCEVVCLAAFPPVQVANITQCMRPSFLSARVVSLGLGLTLKSTRKELVVA